MALWDYMHLPCNGRYLPCGCYALIWRVYHYMRQSHIVIWQMLFIIHSFGNLMWSPAIQWFSFESNIYYKVVTFKVVFIIIYFLLCFTSACYPLAMADTILASVGVNFWQFIVIWQELYMYTTWISYLLLYYKAGWKRWLYLLYMLGVPTLL